MEMDFRDLEHSTVNILYVGGVDDSITGGNLQMLGYC